MIFLCGFRWPSVASSRQRILNIANNNRNQSALVERNDIIGGDYVWKWLDRTSKAQADFVAKPEAFEQAAPAASIVHRRNLMLFYGPGTETRDQVRAYRGHSSSVMYVRASCWPKMRQAVPDTKPAKRLSTVLNAPPPPAGLSSIIV